LRNVRRPCQLSPAGKRYLTQLAATGGRRNPTSDTETFFAAIAFLLWVVAFFALMRLFSIATSLKRLVQLKETEMQWESDEDPTERKKLWKSSF
jgi:hypothetical protein